MVRSRSLFQPKPKAPTVIDLELYFRIKRRRPTRTSEVAVKNEPSRRLTSANAVEEAQRKSERETNVEVRRRGVFEEWRSFLRRSVWLRLSLMQNGNCNWLA